MIDIVPARLSHVGPIATRMREADRIECAAFSHTPKQSLRSGLRASVLASTAKVNGRPEAMFGVSPVSVIEGVGCPWFLATDAAFDCARALLCLGPQIIGLMHYRFRRLENRVAVNNRRAINMLRHWGFEIGNEVAMFGGVEFLPFWRES